MMKALFLTIPLTATLLLSGATAQDAVADLKKQAAATYSNIAFHTYSEALNSAQSMQATLLKMITAPNQLAHIDARVAWIESRPPYLQSEVFRFYGGPIDKLESAINSPADAAAIDAIIDGTEAITADTVSTVAGGTGYHAIEYLLWGADKAVDGPGHRSFTDYTSDAPNATRRSQYLRSVTALLVDHLQKVTDHWKPDVKDNFRSLFDASAPDAALQRLFTGAAKLASAEIAEKRIRELLKSGEGENEHSPFSDTTHVDILHATAGIANVLAGAYIGIDGKIKVQSISPIAVMEKADAPLAEKLKTATNAAMKSADGIGKPLDQAVIQPESSSERKKMTDCADALDALAAQIRDSAKALGITVAE